MARGRMISKSLSTSKKYAELYRHPLGEFCQALFPLLVSHADDFGRLEGDVFSIKHAVVPACLRPENEIADALTLLDAVRLVAWYAVDGARFVQIVDFERHQTGLHKRTSSRFPRVPGNSRKFREVPEQLKGTELKGTELNGTRAARDSAPVPIDSNIGVITRVAHEVIDELGIASPDLTETVKAFCARRRIAYDSTTVNKAVDSAIAQRERKHGGAERAS